MHNKTDAILRNGNTLTHADNDRVSGRIYISNDTYHLIITVVEADDQFTFDIQCGDPERTFANFVSLLK